MPNQTESGKAFEYALAVSLFKKLHNVKFVKDSSYNIAQKCFNLFNGIAQQEYMLASQAAIQHIINLEPHLEDEDTMTIAIQSDQKGITGDVRDIVLLNSANWQIGFSAKNNHNAVKHSRLSDKIDFGEKWFGIKCSKNYMNEVKSIFCKLRDMKTTRWKHLHNKAIDYYIPTLEAFKTEICRLIQEHDTIPMRLIMYLLGNNDFYKIMKYDKYTQIQGYNLYGTLNEQSDVKPKYNVKKLNFPTEIIKTQIVNNNKLEMIFDNGWELSFRIHNARTKIESSLKFDVQLVGIPNNMYNDREWW